MLSLLPVEKIKIPVTRQRKQFDADRHQELCESLQYTAVGLQHAIVVRQEGDTVYLVSGERRLRAMTDIYELGGTIRFGGQSIESGLVPCIEVGELGVLDRWEAELEENINRVEISWQEKASATAELWELRKAQAAKSGTLPPTMSEFTEEVRPAFDPEQGGFHQDAVRKEIILSKHLDDPDVAAAKTSKEAFKILKVKEQRQRNAEMSAIVGENYSAAKHTLVLGNALVWMAAQPEGKFDVILSDPPYGMGADEFGDSGRAGTIGSHQYVDSWEFVRLTLEAFIDEGFRITRPDAHLYMFCDFDHFHEIKEMAEQAGWNVFRTPLIWSKPAAFRAPWPEAGPRRTYETILYAIKGDMKVTKLAPDVLTYNADENLGHNAQKPVDLFVDLLSRSVRPGMSVLDPFCGSGPIFPAAHALQCYATGIEQDEASHGIAAKRLGDLS